MTDPNIGRIIANRYQLDQLIGKGAMGKVYLARDILLGDVPVAVKFLAHTLLNDKMRERFRSEARTCAQLGQKTIHIVRVMDYGLADDDIPFYVMEYLQGESLATIIKERQLPLPRFLTLSRQICLGLQCAHQDSIVHRDVKPRNILVTQDASIGEMAKVLDFGIAHLMESETKETTSFMGTLAYASPEQMEGKDLDNRSDIYSLGVMMYEMLTNRLPLRPENHNFSSWYKAHHSQPAMPIGTVNPTLRIPKSLDALVMSCLAKSPVDRPQDIGEILRSLEPLDERFQTNRQIGQRLGAALNKLPVVVSKPDVRKFESADDLCLQMTWPKDKPQAEIVFPQVIQAHRESLATLWIMMSGAEIELRRHSSRYNRLMFSMTPHPTVLWVTVIYNREHGPRWLPCYLDLKSQSGLEIARLLADKGYYRLLFFAKEGSPQCHALMATTIAPEQCKQLKEWITSSESFKGSGQASLAKKLLKDAYEKLKPQILMTLESMDNDQTISH